MSCASKKRINAKTTANRKCQIPNRGDFGPGDDVIFESFVIKSAFPIQTLAIGVPFMGSLEVPDSSVYRRSQLGILRDFMSAADDGDRTTALQ
jgi:hypothetical protein